MPFYQKIIPIFKLLYSQWQAEESSIEIQVFFNAHLLCLRETWRIAGCVNIAQESPSGGELTGCVQVELKFYSTFLMVLRRQRWDWHMETFLSL